MFSRSSFCWCSCHRKSPLRVAMKLLVTPNLPLPWLQSTKLIMQTVYSRLNAPSSRYTQLYSHIEKALNRNKSKLAYLLPAYFEISWFVIFSRNSLKLSSGFQSREIKHKLELESREIDTSMYFRIVEKKEKSHFPSAILWTVFLRWRNQNTWLFVIILHCDTRARYR